MSQLVQAQAHAPMAHMVGEILPTLVVYDNATAATNWAYVIAITNLTRCHDDTFAVEGEFLAFFSATEPSQYQQTPRWNKNPALVFLMGVPQKALDEGIYHSPTQQRFTAMPKTAEALA